MEINLNKVFYIAKYKIRISSYNHHYIFGIQYFKRYKQIEINIGKYFINIWKRNNDITA